MKRYFLSFIAMVLAIGFSAFTKSTKFLNLKKFEYNSAAGYSKAAVENLANWTYNAGASCVIGDVKACVIELDADDLSMTKYFHYVSGVPTLNTLAYVNGTSDPTDLKAVIIAEEKIPGSGIYRVSTTGTTATYVINKN